MSTLRTLLLIVAGLTSTPTLTNSSHASEASKPEAFVSAIQAMLTEGHHPFLSNNDLTVERDILVSLYQQRQYRPLWFSDGRPSPQAIALLQALRATADKGLRPEDYEANQIIYEFVDSETDIGSDANRWAQLDLALTTVTLRWVTHLHYGRVDPRRAGFNTPVMPPSHLDRNAVLIRLASTNRFSDVVSEIEPQFRHYRLLTEALKRYRKLAIDSTLTALPAPPVRSVAPGDAYEGAPALHRLLHAIGDLDKIDLASADSLTIDPALAAALKMFQRRHGLLADGKIGKATFAALTTPLAQRVRQIELTLERWRWLPGFERPPIVVNIPQFRLFALRSVEDSEQDMLQMDVIVGRTFTHMRTPIFAADMTYVVFRPYWDVPYSIATREILPQVLAKPGYLAAQNLEIVRGQGDDARPVAATAENLAALAAGQLRLRQPPRIEQRPRPRKIHATESLQRLPAFNACD